jgi:hypothetical protein
MQVFVFSNALLVPPSVPDFSMLANVICMTATAAIAYIIGVLNHMMRAKRMPTKESFV